MNGGIKKVLFALTFLFFAGLATFSGQKVYVIMEEYRVGEASAQHLQQYITLQPEGSETKPSAITDAASDEQPQDALQEPSVQYPTVDFDALQKMNPDVLGWIYIEGTNINYPIVQSTDNDYYLNRLVDGTYNGAGSIFMDYRNAPDFSDSHTVIYGHNMKNKTMFAHITEYKKAEFYEEHPVGKIMTPWGNFEFQIVGGYVADPADPAWELYFESEEEFQDWLRDTMKRSDVGGEYVPVGGERIITLSTCSYEFDNARFVLICRIAEPSGEDK